MPQRSQGSRRWTRRRVLGAGLAAAAIALSNLAAVSRASAQAPAGAGPAFGLAPGAKVGPCTLVRVGGVERGGVPVVLADEVGREFVVEVYRHDARAPGVARAGSLAVYLRNGGDGATRSRESHGLGAMALAARLAARERAGARMPRLASIVERWQRYDGPR